MTNNKEIYYLNQEDYFHSFDLNLAAALVTTNYDLFHIDKANPKKAQFIFKRENHIEVDVKRYWDNDLLLDARRLLENARMLKNRIHSV